MTSVKFSVLPVSDLDASLAEHWRHLAGQNPDLSSPFFDPDYSRLIDRYVPGVFVGLIEQDQKVTGFFPFQKKNGRCGLPVGAHVCDYDGIIGAGPGLHNVSAMLRGFGLACYDFNHALAAQDIFAANAYWNSASPRADLSAGYDSWESDVHRQSKALKTLARHARRLTRDVGPIRFVEQDDSQENLAQFLRWKDDALRQKGYTGFAEEDWLIPMLEELLETKDPKFNGCFSTLYAGDKMVAAHFGMRSARSWHWWFPTYNPDLSNYSPGMQLLQNCIAATTQSGHTEFDFGRGDERYKRQLSNASRPLCEGSLERPLSAWGLTRAGRKSAQRLANRFLNEKTTDVLRKGGNRVLRAGKL